MNISRLLTALFALIGVVFVAVGVYCLLDCVLNDAGGLFVIGLLAIPAGAINVVAAIFFYKKAPHN